jgi:hypothetical protein
VKLSELEKMLLGLRRIERSCRTGRT